MEKQILVGTLDSASCQVSSQISAHFESYEPGDFEHSVTPVNDFESGIKSLSEGDLDLLAFPAIEIFGREGIISDSGCQIIGARTPRRPSLVLVSSDRLMYQPKSAIIVSDSGLVRRQLLRARPDLQAISSVELGKLAPGFVPPDDPGKSTWSAGQAAGERRNRWIRHFQDRVRKDEPDREEAHPDVSAQ
ncbi:MAG: hypothetical protein ACJZ4Q_06530 [Candidatus Thalassarchaeaceae archaeon]